LLCAAAHGKKPLWGTASLFTHPRYMQGAATAPQAAVFARAAAQVKKAMEVTHKLGGLNYVFWFVPVLRLLVSPRFAALLPALTRMCACVAGAAARATRHCSRRTWGAS